MIHKAFYALYPDVKSVNSDNKAFDAQGNEIQVDLDLINSWVDPDAYKQQRQKEYPSIGDQLDALWKGGEAATEMLAKVQAVKTKYPKSE